MKLLLDTHTFLWFTLGDALLSQTALALILDPGNEKLISPASYWEMTIKISMGKLLLHQPFDGFLDRGIRQNGFTILPIEPRHTVSLTTLPFHHKDPFDRLLIAQALTVQLAVVGTNAIFDNYGVTRLW